MRVGAFGKGDAQVKAMTSVRDTVFTSDIVMGIVACVNKCDFARKGCEERVRSFVRLVDEVVR